MRVTQLILEKYKRLMLSNVQRFEYNPTKNMQLIIGSNGSGKSSVLEEMSPLPSHHRNFAKGGRKVFQAVRRDSQYYLESKYTGGSGHHSFLMDGKELNEGHTFAVQKELVEQHFGLTREIHDLLIGQTPFTGMSTAKRREWLTRLTPVDMQYAFEVYQKAKTAHRDQLAMIKHFSKRMANENHDLPDDGEVARYRQQIKDLTDRLNRLFEIRKANLPQGFANDQQLHQQLESLCQRARRVLATHPTMPQDETINSPEALAEAIQQGITEFQSRKAVMDRLSDEHQQLLQQAPSRDESMTEADIQALRHQVQETRQKEQTLETEVQRYHGMFPLVDLPLDRRPMEILQQVYTEWMELIKTFPDNPEGRFSKQKGQQARERLDTLESTLRELDNRQTLQAQRLARLKGCESIVCPNCDHQFQPGVSPKEITQLETSQTELGQQRDPLEKEIEQLKSYLEAYDDYLGYVRQFSRLVKESTLFWSVWDQCMEHNVMFRQPRDYTTAVTEWFAAMQTLITSQQTRQEREVLEHRLRYVEAVDKQAVNQNDQRRQELEQEVNAIQQELSGRRQAIQRLQQIQEEHQRYQTELTEAIQGLEQFFTSFSQYQEYDFQVAVKEETNALQMKLAQVQETLSKIEMREGVLRDLQREHEKASQDHKDYGVLVKALAPTNGLIGRYLMGFMQGVVKMINAVIAEIWTYPMEVMPSQIEKDELDYKFPLNVKNGAVTPPDIGQGSASQRDIVNFAFKLLVMKFLKLEDFPLYLDEFGSTFDEQHRLNLIPFINQMLELNQIDQVFYISHYATLHDAFNHAEVCVLDPSNITVPKAYNDHVKIA